MVDKFKEKHGVECFAALHHNNDIVVAARQKHNGMSWPYSGSHALAVITASVRNNEINNWILNGQMRFSFQPVQNNEDLCVA